MSSSSASGPAAGAAAAPSSGPVVIREGLGEVVFENANAVFYNEVQCYNRDLSVLFLKEYIATLRREQSELKKPKAWVPLTVLEALAASGLRSIRYWKEVPESKDDLGMVVANDLDPVATEAIRRNVVHNGLDPAVIVPSQGDANVVMHVARSPGGVGPFHFVDLDPYGTAAPFLDSGVQAVDGYGGLLAVTCTDKSVLCGNNPEVCVAKYGSVPLRGPHCHEMAVRILLSSISAAASRHGRYIVPLVSLSIDFYVRVWVRVFTSPTGVKRAASRCSLVYQCVGCGAAHLQPGPTCTTPGANPTFQAARGPPVDRACAECGSAHRLGGPIWTDPTVDVDFLAAARARLAADASRYRTGVRMGAMLGTLASELHDVPLFYGVASLAHTFRCSAPKISVLRSVLLHAGYRVSGSHTDPLALKTDAPVSVVMDMFRCLVRDRTPLTNPPEAGSVTERLISKPPTLVPDYTLVDGSVPDRSVVRFPVNPENWGPKSRASSRTGPLAGLTPQEQLLAKRKANQGKRDASKRARVAATAAAAAAAATAEAEGAQGGAEDDRDDDEPSTKQ